MDITEQRLNRFLTHGAPVTVWQREILEKRNTQGPVSGAKEIEPSTFNELRIVGAADSHHSGVSGFRAEQCRACANRFTFRTSQSSATILLGKPTKVRYKAISYVWGATSPLLIQCKCGHSKIVPIASPDRFCVLLSLAAAASIDGCEGVWLDALSIDQDSHSDKQLLLGSMGDIYKDAVSALVLFTPADELLFGCIQAIRDGAIIQDQFDFVGFNNRDGGKLTESQIQICNKFLLKLDDFKLNLDSGTYFRRAWTFQEWSLARDLDITCEKGAHTGLSSLTLLPNVKSAVIRATVRLAIHIRCAGTEATKIHIRGADVPAFIDDIKSLFPQEDVFCTSEEIDWKEKVVDTMLPFTGLNHELGLRLAGKIRLLCSFPRLTRCCR